MKQVANTLWEFHVLHQKRPFILADNFLWKQRESYGGKVGTSKTAPEKRSTFSSTLAEAEEEKT